MKKNEEIPNKSYESDGVMGKENQDRNNNEREQDFFTITPESE